MDKSKIYLDLSKCTEEQQIKAIALLPEPINKDDYDITHLHLYLIYDDEDCMWWVSTKHFLAEKTEITYPEFIKLFEGGEEKKINMTFGITAKNMEIINKQISRFEGAEFDRLSWEKIAKEIGWDLPTIILWYFRKKESQNKWIKP